MAPNSLVKHCQNYGIRNMTRLDEYSLGITPWRLLKPILLKCEDPKMLRKWEQNTPQIRGETGEIWLKFIKRDIPNWRKKAHEPSNPESWWKVYKKLKNEADEEERKAEEMLRDKMSKIKKDENEWRVAPPTKAIPERTMRNKGTAMQFQRGSDNNGLRFTTGSKTKDFMQSVRRQAAESSLQKKGPLARPTSMLNNGVAAKRIMRAPQHMVEDRQRLAEQTRQASHRASGSHKQDAETPPTSLAARAAHDLKMREERLRAVREGRTVPTASPAASPAKSGSHGPKTGSQGTRPTGKNHSSPTPKHSRLLPQRSANSTPGPALTSGNSLSQASSQPASAARSNTHLRDLQRPADLRRSSTPPKSRTPAPPATSGVKRKGGPTILLDVKRKKR